jgi:hypothetical protein
VFANLDIAIESNARLNNNTAAMVNLNSGGATVSNLKFTENDIGTLNITAFKIENSVVRGNRLGTYNGGGALHSGVELDDNHVSVDFLFGNGLMDNLTVSSNIVEGKIDLQTSIMREGVNIHDNNVTGDLIVNGYSDSIMSGNHVGGTINIAGTSANCVFKGNRATNMIFGVPTSSITDSVIIGNRVITTISCNDLTIFQRNVFSGNRADTASFDNTSIVTLNTISSNIFPVALQFLLVGNLTNNRLMGNIAALTDTATTSSGNQVIGHRGVIVGFLAQVAIFP